eukprot:TRINITY_DN4243_c0_g1_i1.p1 TRINITY_DN4243_c0_g1~~TRINITY_DN4243_c0_g1_i1.p1  ORF type:complete len:307 (+),score=40.86 TRINITY_DN4243_c0_g1_i1:243-1163(+)
MWNEGAECSSEPDLIRPGLFLSDFEAAEDKNVLKRCKVSHILNMCGGEPAFPEDFSYLILQNIVDCQSQDMLCHFAECFTFIREGLSNGTGVLVHCAAGISRSATIVTAYLMHAESLTVETALAAVKAARPCVCPNAGFMKQLLRFSELGCQLINDPKYHRKLDLANLARDMHTLPLDLGRLSLSVARDPASRAPSAQSDVINVEALPYRCKRCGRKLFDDCHLMEHNARRPRCYSAAAGKCEHYIEPFDWMADIFTDDKKEGEIQCPNSKCSVVLGSWSWRETSCAGCHARMCPSFVVEKKKVQK